jgi:nitrite reductase (NADH) large subunit
MVLKRAEMEIKNYLIIGTGVAGTASAAAIREHDPDGRIFLLGDEELPLYSRIRLPEYLTGRVERERLVIQKPQWYSDRRIDLMTGTRAESIDAQAGRVFLSGGSALPYDRLLLATGAGCWVPPVPGRGLPGILTVRTVADVDRLKSAAAGQAAAVVVGGGLLGLEMAGAMGQIGLEVTVVEVAPWLLPRQLDREGGELLQRVLEKRGIRFLVGARVDSFSGKDHVEAVCLTGGAELAAAVVLVSAGIQPDVALAREAGIEIQKGITVDDRMATSLPGVYAAGDCALHRGITYGLWPAAEAQGKVAGTQMAGFGATYNGTLPSHTLKVSGVDVFSAGRFDIDDEARCKRNRGEETYQKEVFDDDGNTVGAILIGDLGDRNKIIRKSSRAAEIFGVSSIKATSSAKKPE